MGGPGSGRRKKGIPEDPEGIRFREAAKKIRELAKNPAWGLTVEEFCRIIWPLREDEASWSVLIFGMKRGWFRPSKLKELLTEPARKVAA